MRGHPAPCSSLLVPPVGMHEDMASTGAMRLIALHIAPPAVNWWHCMGHGVLRSHGICRNPLKEPSAGRQLRVLMPCLLAMVVGGRIAMPPPPAVDRCDNIPPTVTWCQQVLQWADLTIRLRLLRIV